MDDKDLSNLSVKHNDEEQRFEALVDEGLAVAQYEREGGRILFTHTLVPREARGRGVAGAVVRAGLDYARAQGLKVVPLCSYVGDYIRRNPEYRDLL